MWSLPENERRTSEVTGGAGVRGTDGRDPAVGRDGRDRWHDGAMLGTAAASAARTAGSPTSTRSATCGARRTRTSPASARSSHGLHLETLTTDARRRRCASTTSGRSTPTRRPRRPCTRAGTAARRHRGRPARWPTAASPTPACSRGQRRRSRGPNAGRRASSTRHTGRPRATSTWAPPGGVARDDPGLLPRRRAPRRRRPAAAATGPAGRPAGGMVRLRPALCRLGRRVVRRPGPGGPHRGGAAHHGVHPRRADPSSPVSGAWSDPGAWEGGGMIGGHDYSGVGRRGRGRRGLGRRWRRRWRAVVGGGGGDGGG